MKSLIINKLFTLKTKGDKDCIHYIIHENNSWENDIVFDVPVSSVKKVTKSYINMVAEKLIEARKWSEQELDNLYI